MEKNNKKILHKIGKHWMVVAIAVLGLFGGTALTSLPVSANNTTTYPVVNASSSNSIRNQANALHSQVLNNAIGNADAQSTKDNYQYQSDNNSDTLDNDIYNQPNNSSDPVDSFENDLKSISAEASSMAASNIASSKAAANASLPNNNPSNAASGNYSSDSFENALKSISAEASSMAASNIASSKAAANASLPNNNPSNAASGNYSSDSFENALKSISAEASSMAASNIASSKAAASSKANLQNEVPTIEKQMNGETLNDINQDRSNYGLSPLTELPQLDKLATMLATYEMEHNGSYTTPDGKDYVNVAANQLDISLNSPMSDNGQNIPWVANSDYCPISSDFRFARNYDPKIYNMSNGIEMADAVNDGMMNYDESCNNGHRDNILQPEAKAYGVGTVYDPSNGLYYSAEIFYGSSDIVPVSHYPSDQSNNYSSDNNTTNNATFNNGTHGIPVTPAPASSNATDTINYILNGKQQSTVSIRGKRGTSAVSVVNAKKPNGYQLTNDAGENITFDGKTYNVNIQEATSGNDLQNLMSLLSLLSDDGII